MERLFTLALMGAGAYLVWPYLKDSLAEVEEARKREAYYQRTPDHIINRDQTIRLTSPRFGGGVPIINQPVKPHTDHPVKVRDDIRLTERVTVHTGLFGGPLWREEFT